MCWDGSAVFVRVLELGTHYPVVFHVKSVQAVVKLTNQSRTIIRQLRCPARLNHYSPFTVPEETARYERQLNNPIVNTPT